MASKEPGKGVCLGESIGRLDVWYLAIVAIFEELGEEKSQEVGGKSHKGWAQFSWGQMFNPLGTMI